MARIVRGVMHDVDMRKPDHKNEKSAKHNGSHRGGFAYRCIYACAIYYRRVHIRKLDKIRFIVNMY